MPTVDDRPVDSLATRTPDGPRVRQPLGFHSPSPSSPSFPDSQEPSSASRPRPGNRCVASMTALVRLPGPDRVLPGSHSWRRSTRSCTTVHPQAWVIAGPLALPLLLTGALAWHQRRNLGFRVGAGRFRARSDALDPEVVDRIISEVAGGLEPGVDAPARTESEAEVAQLAAAIRHVSAPQARMSEARVQKIVADILARSPAPAPMSTDSWRPRITAGTIGIFCAAWACFAAGLLIVSPLGGVPPSVASAVAVGFLGSAAVLWIGRRSPALAATLQT